MTTPEINGPAELFAGIFYSRPLRRYQRLALEAFERNRADGATRAYLVLPPGAGKTVLGLEIARRLGRRALILCPNTAVQAQWLRQWKDFQPLSVPCGVDRDLAAPITALTYAALCNLDRESAALEEGALALWRQEVEAELDLAPERAAAEIERIAATQPGRYADDLAAYRKKARTLTARAGDRESLLALLHPNGRELVERMKRSGPWTLILDECHHLLQMWGSLARALVEELDDEFVVGLTATPPGDMDGSEEELYTYLFGGADFEVPTPAVVKEGDLAPYQELAYLTTPLSHELDYINEQHVRFQELLTHLVGPDFATVPFVDWLQRRVTERLSRGGTQVSWGRFERDHPDLAQAVIRYMIQYDMELPAGVRPQERHLRPLSADDWVAMIEDYCRTFLRESEDPRDREAWEEIRHTLPSLGYVMTRTGIRAYVSPVDRVLALSAAKGVAAAEILGLELSVLGPGLRALVVCDYELAGSETLARLRGVLDPQAGSAALLLRTLVSDPGSAALNPVLVTGRTVACSRATAVHLCRWIEAEVPELRSTVFAVHLFEGEDADWDDVVVVRPAHLWWQPRLYVPLLTQYFESGHSQCLIGTRSLLGEGWDARSVNVLIDLTAAGTQTSVHQLRGRSLRLNPEAPRKVANNWDVVCVAPEHPKGFADYSRFVRKHRRYYAPTMQGEIESGVSHVHSSLSPYGPPASQHFPPINQEMLGRAADREAAYVRWRVGEPYENRDTQTVRVRFGRPVGLHGGEVAPGHAAGRQQPGGRLVAILGAVVSGAWLSDRLQEAGPSDALEDFGAAVAEALAVTGGIGRDLGAHSVRTVAESDGYYRCYLEGAKHDESALFAESLDELLAPLANPRYIIPRYVASPPRSSLEALRLYLRQAASGRVGDAVVYHAVPAYLAVNKSRATAFENAWNRFVSAGEALYIQDPRAQGIVELQRGEDPLAVTTQMRNVWR